MLSDLRRLITKYQVEIGYFYMDLSTPDSTRQRIFVKHLFSDPEFGVIKFLVVASNLSDVPNNTILCSVDGTSKIIKANSDELSYIHFELSDFNSLTGEDIGLYTMSLQEMTLKANYHFEDDFYQYLSGILYANGLRYTDGFYRITAGDIPEVVFRLARLESA